MRISELIKILEESKEQAGDIEIFTQACYEMGMADPQYPLLFRDAATLCHDCNTGKDTFVICFDGYQVLRDNHLNPFTREKQEHDQERDHGNNRAFYQQRKVRT